MKTLAGLAAAVVVCATSLVVAQEAGKAKPGRRQLTPEQKQAMAERLTKQLQRTVDRLQRDQAGAEKRYGKLKSPEALAVLKEVSDLRAAAIAGFEEQIELVKQGKLQRRSAKGYAEMRRMGAAQGLLNIYVAKERATAAAAGDDPKAKADAEKALGICEKLIANHRQMVALQAQQQELFGQLRQLQPRPARAPRMSSGARVKGSVMAIGEAAKANDLDAMRKAARQAMGAMRRHGVPKGDPEKTAALKKMQACSVDAIKKVVGAKTAEEAGPAAAAIMPTCKACHAMAKGAAAK